jgi:hypothetical protein
MKLIKSINKICNVLEGLKRKINREERRMLGKGRD